MTSFMDRAKSAYNILLNRDSPVSSSSPSSSISASINRVRFDTSAAILAPIKTRIAMDAANIPVRHVLVDELDQYVETKQSELNDRLNIMANIDQTGTAFKQNAIMVMLEEGHCVAVPIETSATPTNGTYDIMSMRVGVVKEWYTKDVKVEVYNELNGEKTLITLPKSFVAIAYNPMYYIMNLPNSSLSRLIDKLALLDVADNRMYKQQLDLILQLAYSVKGTTRLDEANRRIQTLEDQLANSRYGVAYVDATEKITQLNRPVVNNLAENIKWMTESFYSQIGLTPSIFSGSATEEEMLAYYTRTIYPVLTALTEAMVGAFFSRTSIRQGNTIRAFPNLFKMAPLEQFATAADTFTRNEIMSSNEIRAVIGLTPVKTPEADELRNKNLNKVEEPEPIEEPKPSSEEDEKEAKDA